MTQSRILYTAKPPKRKKKKISRGKLRAVIVLIGFMLILLGGIGVVRLSYFRIQDVKIAGDGTEEDTKDLRTKTDDVLSVQYSLIIPRRSVFAVDTKVVEQGLLSLFPRFETISVAKQFPHTLFVSYTKRQFFALLCANATGSSTPSCGYVDRTGFVYEEAPDASGSLIVKIASDLPAVHIGMQAIDGETVKQMMLFGEGVSRIAGLRLLAYEITTQAPDELRLKVADGFSIIVKKGDNPETVLHILATVLKEEIKDRRPQLNYIDLRFGNKVFFRFKK